MDYSVSKVVTAPVFPSIEEKDLVVDQDLLQLGEIFGDLTNEFIDSDPKVAYILSKGLQ